MPSPRAAFAIMTFALSLPFAVVVASLSIAHWKLRGRP